MFVFLICCSFLLVQISIPIFIILLCHSIKVLDDGALILYCCVLLSCRLWLNVHFEAQAIQVLVVEVKACNLTCSCNWATIRIVRSLFVYHKKNDLLEKSDQKLKLPAFSFNHTRYHHYYH
jgi:hypothetical protein